MKIARPIRKLTEAFERLPGIGPKTAARLTYYVLHMPENRVDEFAEALFRLKRDTVRCSQCLNISEHDPCEICEDPYRDKSLICVVEQPLDVLAIERSNKFDGVYHVLHGVIEPLRHIGPDDIFLNELINRVTKNELQIQELVLALNPTMEGDATAMYIREQLKSLNAERQGDAELKITRLAQGLPLGGDVEYADSVTLGRALTNRGEF